jgi:acetyl esterase/lipase
MAGPQNPESPGGTHVIVLPGGGYVSHAAHEGEPVARWLEGIGVRASVFRYPLNVRHPVPLDALRAEIRRRRAEGARRIGLMGFSAGGHLAGLAALAPASAPGPAPGATSSAAPDEAVQFAVLGYAITSMRTETYRPARLVLLGQDASPALRRATSLDALVTAQAPPFFIWHTAEDPYVAPEHAYLLASALAASHVPHAVHVFTHGPHSLGLAQGSGEAAIWTELAGEWIREQASLPGQPAGRR